ncbi:response regulator receiver modulated CheB methylesterase [Desulfitobacterium hafniense DCB-2]|uniref:Protein-glutamate methylesterase/protein-glutamine glutaminase n=2 Tax=root TaxID=1 RepID=B8FTR9_DESHD|nr:chemotaxis response regulator protein-glutamate methylesterase [Desulfitobacterium hafniense]ACL22161.1 response regulator receiver modulated CheB methylesterase [Desulfitobacterium hafniense DCB-2]MEA5021295.1 chemotaxis response regulator protein-glutamate methylesterase [Desulfitobacterium hafniense]
MNQPKSPITVLIVDDSPFMRLTLQKILSQDPEIKVLDTARDGKEGIEKLQALRPQVVTMDIEMPQIDGLQALGEIMRWQPTPIIILSALTTEGAQASVKALEAGAFDVVAKPSGGPGADIQALARDLIDKVKAAAQVNLGRLGKKGAVSRISPASGSRPPWTAGAASENTNRLSSLGSTSSTLGSAKGRSLDSGEALPKYPVEIVAIGTSTGGPSALQAVLTQLPGNLPVPVLVAQHMPPGFTAPLAQRLNGMSPLTIREGVHGEALKAGTIYFAPAGKQMQVQSRGSQLILHIGDESPITTLYHPSVDVMFMSLAKEVGKGTLGVVMTGMGNDGLRGMREIKERGGYAIAEAEETCVVYGMPRAIVDAGLANRVAPLGEIARHIVECVQRR